MNWSDGLDWLLESLEKHSGEAQSPFPSSVTQFEISSR